MNDVDRRCKNNDAEIGDDDDDDDEVGCQSTESDNVYLQIIYVIYTQEKVTDSHFWIF